MRRGACRVTRTGVAGRGAVGALPSVACCGSRFGRGHGRALREAGPLGPAAARTEDGRVENLAATDIVAFLSAESSPLSVGSTNGRVAELQALLKFLYVAGLAPQPLVTLVPPVAGWHDTGVPKANPAADVQRLLDSCDRTNPIGVSGRRRGPACHGVQPDRLHPRHRSLLQHELADQDLPGGDTGLAPGQIAPGDVIPAEQFGRANRHRASPPVGGTMSTCLTRIR